MDVTSYISTDVTLCGFCGRWIQKTEKKTSWPNHLSTYIHDDCFLKITKLEKIIEKIIHKHLQSMNTTYADLHIYFITQLVEKIDCTINNYLKKNHTIKDLISEIKIINKKLKNTTQQPNPNKKSLRSSLPESEMFRNNSFKKKLQRHLSLSSIKPPLAEISLQVSEDGMPFEEDPA